MKLHEALQYKPVLFGRTCTDCSTMLPAQAMQCVSLCHALCSRCYDQTTAAMKPVQSNKHAHVLHEMTHRAASCDGCRKTAFNPTFSCEYCDYDLCAECAGMSVPVPPTRKPLQPALMPVPIPAPAPGAWGRVGFGFGGAHHGYAFHPSDDASSATEPQLTQDILRVSPPSSPSPSPAPTPAPALRSDHAGALQLFKIHATAAEATKNVFISPLSIQLAFGLALQGATPGSAAQREMCSAVFAAPVESVPAIVRDLGNTMRTFQKGADGVTLAIANAVFARADEIRESYMRQCKDTLHSEAHPLPSTPEPINEWCSTKTRGKIKKIIDDIDEATIAVLLNAVYLKASWTDPFEERATIDGTFVTPQGTAKPCKMMRRTATMACMDTEMFSACRVPYGKSKEYAAWFVLPKSAASANELIARADTVFESLRSPDSREVALQCPRFKLECGPLSLKPTLRALGMDRAFKGERLPDGRHGFDAMARSDEDDVYISDVLHNAVCEVNEEGTVAAAVTAIVMMKECCMRVSEPLRITLDREFLFCIVHVPTHRPLFLGRVTNPQLDGIAATL